MAEQLRVVAAAVRLRDGLVVVGVRHFDELMRATIGRINNSKPNDLIVGAKQGFVLSNYRFVDRETACTVAKKSGQIPDSEQTTLYSEDVW